jgi:hypothetical protein
VEGFSKDGPKWVNHNLCALPSWARVATSEKVICSDSSGPACPPLSRYIPSVTKKVCPFAFRIHELNDAQHYNRVLDQSQVRVCRKVNTVSERLGKSSG